VIGRSINTKRSGKNGYASTSFLIAPATASSTSFMPLPDKAKKLIILLMDGSAADGERDTATRKLIECLRTNFKDGYALLEEWGNGKKAAAPPPAHSSSSVYGEFTMPFGQYKGQPIREVPVDYLLYILDWNDLWPTTKRAIQRYLDSF
jgi:hypothetical protein